MSLPTEAKARKAIPVYSGFVKYFPDAIAAVAELSQIANEQHNPGTDVHWDRSKSKDELDAMMRHTLDMAGGTESDADGVLHATKQAWRSMANLQKLLESKKIMTATEVQERWKAGPSVAPRIGYVRYIGNGPRHGWWWNQGDGLTDNLLEAGIFTEFPVGALRIEFVPKNEADELRSLWLLRYSNNKLSYKTICEYTEREARTLFEGQYVSMCRI